MMEGITGELMPVQFGIMWISGYTAYRSHAEFELDRNLHCINRKFLEKTYKPKPKTMKNQPRGELIVFDNPEWQRKWGNPSGTYYKVNQSMLESVFRTR